ncbi:MFS transporter, partial [Burkholderia gladioli]
MSTASAIADGPNRPVVAPPPAQTRRALFALGVGGFGIGTGEFVIMGLLPDAARDLAITIP